MASPDEDLTETCRDHVSKFGEESRDWIAVKDMAQALRTMDFNPSDEDIKVYNETYATQPKGCSRRISVEDFTTIVMELSNTDPAEELREAFHSLAGDKDYLTANQFRKVMKQFADVDDCDLDDVMLKADKDGDGQIDIEEFVEALMGV